VPEEQPLYGIGPFDLHSCGFVTPPLTPEVATRLASRLGL
jgi:hypothetical protein